tara:strand:+ start:4538 stop:4930 length:393 start_codon:yes stop_codon:yes gene_type:complete
METHLRTGQNGSIVGFLVVGVLLVALAAGGVYLVQQRNSNAPAEESGSRTGAPTTSSEQQAESGGSSDNQRTTNSTPSVSPNASVDHAEGLPETGPVDSLATILMSAVLAGAITAYMQSSAQRRFVNQQY